MEQRLGDQHGEMSLELSRTLSVSQYPQRDKARPRNCHLQVGGAHPLLNRKGTANLSSFQGWRWEVKWVRNIRNQTQTQAWRVGWEGSETPGPPADDDSDIWVRSKPRLEPRIQKPVFSYWCALALNWSGSPGWGGGGVREPGLACGSLAEE